MQAAMGKAAEWVKEWMNVGIHYGIYKEKFSCSSVEQQPNNERFESNMRCLESNATQIPIYMKWNYGRSQCLCSDCDWVRWIGVKTIQNERAVVCVGIASDSIYWWDFYCLFVTDDQSQRFNTTKYDFIMWSMSVHSVSNAMKETLEQVIGVNVRSEIVRDNHFRIWNAVERENELCAGECCDGCYHNIKLVKTMHAGCIESNALFTVDHRPSWVNPSNIIVGTSRARLQTIDNALTGRKCMCFIVCNEIETRTGHVATQTRRCIYLSPCDGTNWMIYWLVNCLLYKIKSEEFLPSHGEREKMRFRFRLDVVKVDGDSTCIWFIGFADDRQRRHNMDRLCQLW